MQNLGTSVNFGRDGGPRADDVRRRAAECRERLRKGRGARRIPDCAAPEIGGPFGDEAESSREPAAGGGTAESA